MSQQNPKPEAKRPSGRPPVRSGKIDATPEEVARAIFARRAPKKKEEDSGEDHLSGPACVKFCV